MEKQLEIQKEKSNRNVEQVKTAENMEIRIQPKSKAEENGWKNKNKKTAEKCK